ncbi:TetR/AcrR family transcriptional regulator [Curtobacterium sp. Leaf261]|uniref:TetR/AcrR family transcriptional regulator n=1 Tax=Curtobacterium sp. Leaf261 TaxID=1736311 RepID=UPI0006F95F4E|nr:TetR/AcrR family transcriptional regulator [Curtobacterium sp. Leaf261]KQO63913.1 TetR family transcriptional regulator [Curtobacterium sp. Leaf261]
MTSELPRLARAEQVGVDELRADARDNRDRILEAARELLARQGLGVGMREVARRAEVGPATVYRRFPTKQALVEAAFAVELASCRAIVEEGCADQDAWHGFVGVVERLTALNVRNQGFVDAFMSADPAAIVFTEHRRDLLGLLGGLAERARRQGGLRSDFVIDDLVLVLLAGRGLSSVPPARRAAAADRFAALAVDALRR